MQQPEQQKRIAAKPSLLSPSDQNGTEDVRILSTLSHGGSPPAASPPAKRRFGLFAFAFGLFVMTVAGTLMYWPDNTLVALSPVTASAQSAPADTTIASKPTQTLAGIPAAGKSDPTAAPEAAAIITDESRSTEQSAIAKIDGQDKLTTALETGVKPQPAALQTALDAPAAPAKPKPVVHAPLVNRVATAKAGEHAAKSGKQAAKPGMQAANQSRKQVDSDLNLITALVAYSTEREQKQAAKGAVAVPQKLAQNSTTRTSAKAAGRNQDVVERQMSDSTESLLQRCRNLGFVEGELCRWRICSDRWDTDAACKSK